MPSIGISSRLASEAEVAERCVGCGLGGGALVPPVGGVVATGSRFLWSPTPVGRRPLEVAVGEERGLCWRTPPRGSSVEWPLLAADVLEGVGDLSVMALDEGSGEAWQARTTGVGPRLSGIAAGVSAEDRGIAVAAEGVGVQEAG